MYSRRPPGPTRSPRTYECGLSLFGGWIMLNSGGVLFVLGAAGPVASKTTLSFALAVGRVLPSDNAVTPADSRVAATVLYDPDPRRGGRGSSGGSGGKSWQG